MYRVKTMLPIYSIYTHTMRRQWHTQKNIIDRIKVRNNNLYDRYMHYRFNKKKIRYCNTYKYALKLFDVNSRGV